MKNLCYTVRRQRAATGDEPQNRSLRDKKFGCIDAQDGTKILQLAFVLGAFNEDFYD
jgi:hypothetical protein